jgi:hypothetical protein
MAGLYGKALVALAEIIVTTLGMLCAQSTCCNLLRTLMMEAARASNHALCSMSFAGTRDAVCNFASTIAHARTTRKREAAVRELQYCIGTDPIPT